MKYTYGSKERTVTVLKNSALSGQAKWIAFANFDKFLYSDPVMTKREAKEIALEWINDSNQFPICY